MIPQDIYEVSLVHPAREEAFTVSVYADDAEQAFVIAEIHAALETEFTYRWQLSYVEKL